MKKEKRPYKRDIPYFFSGIFNRFFITTQMFSLNGMANHAAAGAYGFLLSSAPALLIISFFLSRILRSSPETAIDLISNIDFMNGAFDAKSLIEQFLLSSKPGISGVISVISILWAARVFALALLRGIKVVFADTNTVSPLRDVLITVIIELGVILFALVWLLNSQFALRFYETLVTGFSINPKVIDNLALIGKYLPLAGMAIITYLMFRIIPPHPPKQKAAIQGTVISVVLFALVSYALQYILDPSRYNFLYGALGSLIMLLANVYFFFIFFFYGAQFSFVINSYDALMFSQLCHTFEKKTKKYNRERMIRAFDKSTLKKYIRHYKAGDIIFRKDDKGRDVYYVVSGEAGVYLDDPEKQIATIHQGGFFGEMEFLLNEKRNAMIIAKKNLIALQMPPAMFNEILKNDPTMDRWVIETLSKQLKNANTNIGNL